MYWNVYTANGDLCAKCQDAETAAILLAALGTDSYVRHGTRLVYTEGVDGEAGESYDAAAEIMYRRAGV